MTDSLNFDLMDQNELRKVGFLFLSNTFHLLRHTATKNTLTKDAHRNIGFLADSLDTLPDRLNQGEQLSGSDMAIILTDFRALCLSVHEPKFFRSLVDDINKITPISV